MPNDRIRLKSIAAVFGIAALGVVEGDAQVKVTQEHNNPSGTVFTSMPVFALSAAANLACDLSFNGTISGNVCYNCTATNRLTSQSRYSDRHQSYGESYQDLKNMLTRFRRLT